MKRTLLLIAAIVAALVVYDRTTARSSKPTPRAVSGGPTVVFDTFQDAPLKDPGEDDWIVLGDTNRYG